ncbi:hypothetical protein [Halosimplex sp. TS25]|uniref:hypothetical protein n=1 Tax=Halosimplex rarum TaxID=3396619 RepID=UPI0039ECD92B
MSRPSLRRSLWLPYDYEFEVDVGNERALAFYESLGFESSRHAMTVSVAET